MVEPELYRTDRCVSDGLCSIEGMRIRSADQRVGTYEGQVSLADHIEGCNWTAEWIASTDPSKAQEILGRYYCLDIKPKEKNSLTGGPHFTLLEGFNKAIEHYIAHEILTFNPNLPTARVDYARVD